MRVFVTVLLVGGLLAHAAAHVALVAGLARKHPRVRALVAFVLPPLAPYWGWRAGMNKRAAMWLGSVLTYAVAVALSEA